MPKFHSLDLRERVVGHVEKGHAHRAADRHMQLPSPRMIAATSFGLIQRINPKLLLIHFSCVISLANQSACGAVGEIDEGHRFFR